MTDTTTAAPKPGPGDTRGKIVTALMTLAAERRWDDISLSDVAERAGVSLADFRDHFPSKGAVLAAWSRGIDRKVLDGTTDDLAAESAKERLFDVLMRRLDAMAPDKDAIDGIMDWARRDPLAAAAMNRLAVNSMRFMLEAAHIDSEGPLGALKLQGLVVAWTRILGVWLQDREAGLSETMAALDRELDRGGKLVGRAEDLNRIVSPLHALARSLMEAGARGFRRPRSRTADREDDAPATQTPF
jgi:AcrR family transcriptional regulator